METANRNFQLFWTLIIDPIIQKAFQEVDSDFKSACNLDYAYTDMKRYETDLEAFYIEKREWLKRVYLPHDDEPVLDMHKLGAILCRSIIAYKPFYLDFDKAKKYIVDKFGNSDPHKSNLQWYLNNVYVNYKVAFYASVGLVWIEILYKSKVENNIDRFDFFSKKGQLLFYPKPERHDDFESSCILALQKNDILKRDFDYLTHAIMLYQLEQHNLSLYAAADKDGQRI